jgi:hypothetical protein
MGLLFVAVRCAFRSVQFCSLRRVYFFDISLDTRPTKAQRPNNDPVAAYHKGSFKRTQAAPYPPRPLGAGCVAALLRLLDPAVVEFSVVGPMGFTMRRIIQANIDRFKNLLKTETDATKRTMEKRLLAEEEAKLKQLLAYDKKEPKAY